MRNSSFEFFIDLPANCIFAKHYGIFDLEASITRGKAVAADDCWQKGLNRMIDLTGCVIDWETEDVRTMSDIISSQASSRGTYREAFLVDSLLAHGLLRILDGIDPSPTIEYQIFDNRKGAVRGDILNWLQVDANHSIPGFISLL